MNLAYRDVRHNLFRFLLTCFGLSLLLSVVLAMIGSRRPSRSKNMRLKRSKIFSSCGHR